MPLTKVSYSMITGSVINAFDYMTAAQIQDVQSGTGSVDVTAALQAALDAGYSATLALCKAVYLPSGKYLITSSLLLRDNACIFGENSDTTIIQGVAANFANKSLMRNYYAENPSSGQTMNGWNLREFTLQLSTGSYTATTIGLNMRQVASSYVYKVNIYNVDYGIRTNGYCQYNTLDKVKIQANNGMNLIADGGGNLLLNCQIGANTLPLNIVTGVWEVVSGTYEDLGSSCTRCILVGLTPAAGTDVQVTMFGVYVEGNNASTTALEIRASVTFSACYNLTIHNVLGPIVDGSTAGNFTLLQPNYYNPAPFLAQRVAFSNGINTAELGSINATSGNLLNVRNNSNSGAGSLSVAILFPNGGAPGNSGVYAGSGSPEGVLTAAIGSIYLRSDGGAGTSLYVKETGTGNTGWVGK